MARGPKTSKLRPDESRQRQFRPTKELDRLMLDEAERFDLTVPQFVRMLLRRKKGLEKLERPAGWSVPKFKPKKGAEALQLGIILPANLHLFVTEVANRLGNGSATTILSHYVLEWFGQSPLSPGVFATDAPKKTPTPASKRPRGQARLRRTAATERKKHLFSIAEPVKKILDDEAVRVGSSHSDLFRSILRSKAGLLPRERPDTAPTIKALANKEHQKLRYSIALSAAHVTLVDELSLALGNGERSTIVSHLVLEYFGVSPLLMTYPFEPKRRRA